MEDFWRWFSSNHRPWWIQILHGIAFGIVGFAGGAIAASFAWYLFPWSIVAMLTIGPVSVWRAYCRDRAADQKGG